MGLYAVSALITFLLQTTVEWAICFFLAHITRSPRARFRLWLALFVGIFLQWAWFVSGIAGHSISTTDIRVPRIGAGTTPDHTVVVAQIWENRAAAIFTALTICYG